MRRPALSSISPARGATSPGISVARRVARTRRARAPAGSCRTARARDRRRRATIGWCTVTSLVPSGNVPSTWTSCDHLGHAVHHLAAAEQLLAEIHQLGDRAAVADQLEQLRRDQRDRLGIVEPQAAREPLLREERRPGGGSSLSISCGDRNTLPPLPLSRERIGAERVAYRLPDDVMDRASRAPRSWCAASRTTAPHGHTLAATCGRAASAPRRDRAADRRRGAGEAVAGDHDRRERPGVAHAARRARRAPAITTTASASTGAPSIAISVREREALERPALAARDPPRGPRVDDDEPAPSARAGTAGADRTTRRRSTRSDRATRRASPPSPIDASSREARHRAAVHLARRLRGQKQPRAGADLDLERDRIARRRSRRRGSTDRPTPRGPGSPGASRRSGATDRARVTTERRRERATASCEPATHSMRSQLITARSAEGALRPPMGRDSPTSRTGPVEVPLRPVSEALPILTALLTRSRKNQAAIRSHTA